MPRVSAAHLAARRRQILDAARRCFIRNGFHATSMQDVIGEAGLSVGAVYRYFPSKTHLVVGISELMAAQVTAQLSARLSADGQTLTQAMEAAVAVIEANAGPDGNLRLAVQVWAEAQRDPDLALLVRRLYGGMLEVYIDLARRGRDRGELPADADLTATGATLASLVLGYGLLRLLAGGPDLETYRAGIRALLDG